MIIEVGLGNSGEKRRNVVAEQGSFGLSCERQQDGRQIADKYMHKYMPRNWDKHPVGD